MALTGAHADSSFGQISSAVLNAVLKIGLMVGVGIRLEKIGMLNGPKRKCLSALAMDICLPCLMFHDVLPEANLELLQEGWQLLLWPFCYTVVSSSIGLACCLLVGTPRHHLGSAAVCAAFPNVNGFPVSIISALGHTLPRSPAGFSAMVFLSLIQLTDGVLKYTLGPAIFRRDLRMISRGKSDDQQPDHLPLGASLQSITRSISPQGSRVSSPGGAGVDPQGDGPHGEARHRGPGSDVTDFGLEIERVRTVEPEWSRFESYMLFRAMRAPFARAGALGDPLLSAPSDANSRERTFADFRTSGEAWVRSTADLLRQLFPPQVSAVMLAIAIGLGPAWIRDLLVPRDPLQAAPLGWVHGAAGQLGGGFVPLQMISLGGRLVNVASDSGPLSSSGAAGPRGRGRLLRIASAVAVARMILSPVVMYYVAVHADRTFHFSRPLAFWAPALIVAAMPTANNMSTMADLVGVGRSIAASTTALQLLLSPLTLTLTLTVLLAGAQYDLASDYIE